MIPIDKLLHLIVGLALGANPVIEPELALATVVVAAVGKEIYDSKHKHKHTSDWKDAAVTIAGGLLVFTYRVEF